jgi:dCTP deaminase
VILSDGTIREALASGRIGDRPARRRRDPALQRSTSGSARAFRVFANHRYPYIDVRRRPAGPDRPGRGADGEPFVLHPGEFVLGSTLERITLPTTSSPGSRARARWPGSGW